MDKFKQLGLSTGMLQAVKTAGFSEPSEIQEKTIPLALAGKDVIGNSATGSGKTLAFGAAIIEKVKRGEGIQALILTPTRELAEQVAMNLKKFSKHKGLTVKEVYGGVSLEGQISGLRRADIIVGTPGRLLDHMKRNTFKLSKIKYLVLDEADRMLDMGFIKDVENIIRACPRERQTFLFSATMSEEIARIADRHMKSPVKVSVSNQVDPSKLYQVYYEVTPETKFSLLVNLLRLEKNGVVMVFCNTRRNVDRLTRALHDESIDAKAIHGGLSQNKRSSTLQSFHDRKTLILVCTDVAARGLDIKDVSHVYNFDIPAIVSDYIHRIGRTARAGKNGIAISFVSTGDHTEFRQISKSMNIEKMKMPALDKVIPMNFGSNEERKLRRQGGGRGRSFGGRGGGGSRSRQGGGDSRSGRSFSGRRGGGRSGGGDSRSGFGGRERRSSFGIRDGSRGGGRGGRNSSSRFGQRRGRR